MFFCSLATAHLDYHISLSVSSIIFYFFKTFLKFLSLSVERFVIVSWLVLFVNNFFKKVFCWFFTNHTRTSLAKPFRVSHKKTTFMSGGCSQTQRVGFEPTCPLGQTVFKTASLWPLRYLCLTFIRFFHRRCQRQDVYYHMFFYMSTSFFNFFHFLFIAKISAIPRSSGVVILIFS